MTGEGRVACIKDNKSGKRQGRSSQKAQRTTQAQRIRARAKQTQVAQYAIAIPDSLHAVQIVRPHEESLSEYPRRQVFTQSSALLLPAEWFFRNISAGLLYFYLLYNYRFPGLSLPWGFVQPLNVKTSCHRPLQCLRLLSLYCACTS